MSLKKKFKQYISSSEKRIDILYGSSKYTSLVMAFLFFLSYFCISAGFYQEYFNPIFLPLYIGFLLSFIVFLSV
jgi:hypothetical protein